MSGLGVKVRVTEDSKVLEILNGLVLNATRKKELLEEIGINWAENTRLRFQDQETPQGDTWIPSRRALLGGPGQTLLDTGVLRNSITHEVLSENAVEVGTMFPYAHVLHWGMTITAKNAPYLVFRIGRHGPWVKKKSVTIPPRPFLGMSAEDEETILDVINSFLSLTGK